MKIIWDNPRASQCNTSTNDHICHIHQENKQEYNGVVYQLFTDFKKAYN